MVNSTFSPNANGVGADASQSLIARTPLTLQLNVALYGTRLSGSTDRRCLPIPDQCA